MGPPTERLVLASASTIRAKLLATAGVDFMVEPADIDEKVLKEKLAAAGASADRCALRGHTHVLETAVCVVRNGERRWCAATAPRRMMRRFAATFLDDYLAAEGEAILGSVGAYRLEGRGIQLFERIRRLFRGAGSAASSAAAVSAA